MPKVLDPVVRFWSKVEDRHDAGLCWVWTGYRDKDGYGHFWYTGRGMPAHHFSFYLATGRRFPRDCGLHKCDNPSCVNPNHLFEGTKKDNAADAVAKGRHCRGESCARSKLTTAKVLLIRDLFTEGETNFVSLGKRFDITPENASAVVNRKTWRYV